MNCNICTKPMQLLLVNYRCYNVNCGQPEKWYMVADKDGCWAAALDGYHRIYYILYNSEEIALENYPEAAAIYEVTLKPGQEAYPLRKDIFDDSVMYGTTSPPDEWRMVYSNKPVVPGTVIAVSIAPAVP